MSSLWRKPAAVIHAASWSLRDLELGLFTVRSLACFVVDDDDAPGGFEIGPERLQVAGAILDVVQHVVKEEHVHVLGRQVWIGELARAPS